MSEYKLGRPLFVNVHSVGQSSSTATTKLNSLRNAAEVAKVTTNSKVDADRQRRKELIESIGDRAMRKSLEKK